MSETTENTENINPCCSGQCCQEPNQPAAETKANPVNAGNSVKVVGVRFKRVGRVYYYDPAAFELKVNDWVVVITPRGQKLGQVVISPEQVLTSELTESLKPVLRKATTEDIQRAKDLEGKEIETVLEAGKIVTKLNLPMKLIAAEYNLEGNNMTIYFKSADRVDFRELVKELNSHFRMRVELRQVGPRDEAKMVGGFGRCGRTLCCATFLDEFAPVSIKMAKQQNLPLNPTKIAGACGRLLCCLAYESEPMERRPDQNKGKPVEEEVAPAEEPIPEESPVVNDVSNPPVNEVKTETPAAKPQETQPPL